MLVAGAVLLDLIVPETAVEPATLLTAALVGVTIYYAIQNRRMAGTMREQHADFRASEIQRQRAVEIFDVHPLLAQIPKLNPGRREAKWEIHVGDRPVLNLTAILRAMAAEPDPNAVDGRTADVGGLGSYGPGSPVIATLTLDRFLGPGGGWKPFEPVWELELTYHGILGQWVIETYEWQIQAIIDDDRSRTRWQLRRLQIQPTTPAAESVDLRFDPT